MTTFSRRAFLAGTAGALAMPAIGRAQNASRTVRFAVDWVWQLNHSIWTYAQDKGLFAAEKVGTSLCAAMDRPTI